jgi:hypothetical protein
MSVTFSAGPPASRQNAYAVEIGAILPVYLQQVGDDTMARSQIESGRQAGADIVDAAAKAFDRVDLSGHYRPAGAAAEYDRITRHVLEQLRTVADQRIAPLDKEISAAEGKARSAPFTSLSDADRTVAAIRAAAMWPYLLANVDVINRDLMLREAAEVDDLATYRMLYYAPRALHLVTDAGRKAAEDILVAKRTPNVATQRALRAFYTDVIGAVRAALGLPVKAGEVDPIVALAGLSGPAV